LAALGVVVYHLGNETHFTATSTAGHLFIGLNVGVSIFFALSGFLLFRPYVVAHLNGERGAKTMTFWRRRLLRIVPAFWLIALLRPVLFHKPGGPINAWWVVVNLGFLQTFVRHPPSPAIGAAWTLCTELTFYLLLPLYAAALIRKRRNPASQLRVEVAGVIGLIVFGLAFRFLVHFLPSPQGVDMTTWLPAFIQVFALGMLLAVASAWWEHRGWEPNWSSHPASNALWWGAALLAYIVVTMRIGLPYDIHHPITWAQAWAQHLLYALIAVLVLVPVATGPQEVGSGRRFLQSRAVHVLGLLSYSIYLWHQAIMAQLHDSRWAWSLPFPVLLALLVGLTTVAATITYFAVERPFLRRRRDAPRADSESQDNNQAKSAALSTA
jgi:peptidoglycan/LPS O-acetylase OafA/YrhL